MTETVNKEVLEGYDKARINEDNSIFYEKMSMLELLEIPLRAMDPPKTIRPSDLAEKELRLFGGGVTQNSKFSFTKTYYQKEVLNAVTDDNVKVVALAAPSRSGKTYITYPIIFHAMETDPRDTMVIPPTFSAAKVVASEDLAPFIKANPSVEKRMLRNSTNMTKRFDNGMLIEVVNPTATNLAGKNRGLIIIQDYDRIPLNISGEGSVASQARARMKIYGKRGKMFIESSPSKLPKHFEHYELKSHHEAPPYPGIFSVYNEGTRELWFWKCVCCNKRFEAHSRYFQYDSEGSVLQRARSVRIKCPHCEVLYSHDGEEGMPGKDALNRAGKWLPEGCRFNDNDEIEGTPRETSTRSFWLNGAASGNHNWVDIIADLIAAEEKAEKTGDENDLMNVLNTHLCLPWIPKDAPQLRDVDGLISRAIDYKDHFERKVVPKDARYVITTADTQKDGWHIQSHAYTLDGRMYVIHRKFLHFSNTRKNGKHADGADKFDILQPFRHAADWDQLGDYLGNLMYPIEGEDNLFLRPARVAIDSGGGFYKNKEDQEETSATEQAYNFIRRLRRSDNPLRSKIHLLKGEPKDNAPIIEERDQSITGRKDVPVLFIGSTRAKDIFSTLLEREVGDPGSIYLPYFADRSWFNELTAEERVGGVWRKIRARNEAFDLCVYATAIVRWDKVRGDRLIGMSEESLPAYAQAFDRGNSGVVRVESAADGNKEVVPVNGTSAADAIAKVLAMQME